MAKKHAPYKPLKKGTTQPAQQPPVSLKPDMGPGSFIVINILIHSLNTILMCWLANRLSRLVLF
ncbi:MAG: hypothetical protein LH609_19455 [Rudanella sp.]|nr:hypothetical protein [Rudanella sp.]